MTDSCTQNLFYGCDFGLRTVWSPFSNFELDLTTKIAAGNGKPGSSKCFGNTAQVASAGGIGGAWRSVRQAWEAPNGGNFHSYRFAVLPEIALRLRYAVTDCLAVSVGYDFLYWSSVLRPGEQVSGTINSSLAPSQVPHGTGGPVDSAPHVSPHRFLAAGSELRHRRCDSKMFRGSPSHPCWFPGRAITGRQCIAGGSHGVTVGEAAGRVGSQSAAVLVIVRRAVDAALVTVTWKVKLVWPLLAARAPVVKLTVWVVLLKFTPVLPLPETKVRPPVASSSTSLTETPVTLLGPLLVTVTVKAHRLVAGQNVVHIVGLGDR